MSKIIFAVITIGVVFFLIRYAKGNNVNVKANLEEGATFLLENGRKEGVVTTSSGLQFLVLKPGTGTVHPGPSDRVRVHYHGTLIDGTVFDSSVARGEPLEFGLNQVIKGWTEGVQLMVEGEKRRFFIPNDLAYGLRSAGKIGAGSTLIFEVELLKIIK
ncbi:MAG: FKBP-type peptidyl-prolyl cis-trans isomerase [Hahellaceae bacterium]|nr:FKBP-type peptidyl-prolyl cis-trans isomerase [Hahellaceae bacterium]MCP5168279.1 FKBP-type peptidyl-prolyl cis-trans isomerase [Hahellaceae bacterium]